MMKLLWRTKIKLCIRFVARTAKIVEQNRIWKFQKSDNYQKI